MIRETAGQLIKSGKFREAMPLVTKEIKLALHHGIATEGELFDERYGLLSLFFQVLLNPSDFEMVQKLGNSFLHLEMRIPDYIQMDRVEFEKNVKEFHASIKN